MDIVSEVNTIWLHHNMLRYWFSARDNPTQSWPLLRCQLIAIIKKTPYWARIEFRKDIKSFLKTFKEVDNLDIKTEAFAVKDLLRRGFRFTSY